MRLARATQTLRAGALDLADRLLTECETAAFADLDGDGDLDLYVCHYLRWDESNPQRCPSPDGRGQSYCGPRDFPALPDRLFRNDGGRFVDVTEEAGIVDRDGRRLGAVAADLDGDGLIDLFVANDTTSNLFFRNLGGMRFEERAMEAGLAASGRGGYTAGMGIARGDLDGDGRPEIPITADGSPLVCLHQDSSPGRNVEFQRVGTESNRDGVGARLTLTAGGGYQSAGSPRVHFGLGAATRVDRLEVAWPSDQIDVLENLDADRIHRIVEGETSVRESRPSRRRTADGRSNVSE